MKHLRVCRAGETKREGVGGGGGGGGGVRRTIGHQLRTRSRCTAHVYVLRFANSGIAAMIEPRIESPTAG